jgi:hypothetical protein
LVQIAQEYDLHAITAPEVMLEPEPFYSPLGPAHHVRDCEFVAVIGFTFGRDDARSFSHFCNLLKRYDRPMVVVDPFPEETAGRLAEEIKTKRVYGLPIYWNIFATALLSLAGGGDVANIWKAYDAAMASIKPP